MDDNLHEEVFESTDAGASLTYPMQVVILERADTL